MDHVQESLFTSIDPSAEVTRPYLSIIVHFALPEDRTAFQEVIGQRIPASKTIWYPEAPEATFGTASPVTSVSSQGRARVIGDDRPTLLASNDEFHQARREWRGMPEFVHEDLEAYDSIVVNFGSEEAVVAFEKFCGHIRRGTRQTHSVWYPRMGIGSYKNKRYRGVPPLAPKYPLYIVSKGRADNQMTSRALSQTGVPHHIIVEEDQRADYEMRGWPLATFLTLDPDYKRRYDRLTDQSLSPGSGAARNFAWDHSIATYGAARHWVMDDNSQGFFRFNRNLKTPVADGTVIRVMEEFVDRYENIAMAGPNYFMFQLRKAGSQPPFYLNTRIYSCNLIRNDLPFRWRGRYNEDTILSLDILKAGWATALFNAVLQFKMVTQTQKGGNTTELYGAGTLAKSQMLVDAHPDVARLAKRFHGADGQKRDHHVVDYDVFKTALKLRDGIVLPDGADEFGMILERVDPQTGRWVIQDSPWYPWEDGR